MTQKQHSSSLIHQKRIDFEHKTWKSANAKGKLGQSVLYDAGSLGYCLLTWGNGYWRNTWFDEVDRSLKGK